MKIVPVLLACLVWPGPALMAAETNTGQAVFQNMCSRCHTLPAPEKRTATQWNIIVDVMQQVMAQQGIAMLTDEQKQQVLLYLKNNARQVAQKQNTAAHDLFSARCALCHQLPVPDMLKPKQWKIIIQTMQQRMKKKGMPELTEQERQQILGFLALGHL